MAALDPQNSTARYSLGAVYMDLNRPKDAEREIRKALALSPKDPGAHLQLGLYYVSQHLI